MTHGVDGTRRRTRKRPLAASFFTTGFLLSMSNGVRSAPSPSWKAFGFGESNNNPTVNKDVNNNIHRPEQDKITTDSVQMNLDDNNHHGVVRRPRREESSIKDTDDSSKIPKSHDKVDQQSNINGPVVSSPELPIYSTTRYRKPDPRSPTNDRNINTQFSYILTALDLFYNSGITFGTSGFF